MRKNHQALELSSGSSAPIRTPPFRPEVVTQRIEFVIASVARVRSGLRRPGGGELYANSGSKKEIPGIR